jgi:hypothetical protein
MRELQEVLDSLGLQQYHKVLTENGFDTWEVVADITEEDLQELGFKLGHRRILQREIANYRGVLFGLSLDSDGSPLASPQATAGLESFPFPSQSSASMSPKAKEGKRRYRRHPKPDANAPKKPKTAYVNFADHLRTDPSIRSLSFVEIAKEVGRRWQNMPADKKHVWECEAARAMQQYETAMDEYRKSPEYAQYQDYLDEFRRKQIAMKEKKEAASKTIEGTPTREPFSVRSSSSPVSFTSVSTPELEKYNEALTQAINELAICRQESTTPGVRLYDAAHLPPLETVQSAAAALIEGTESFLFIWTFEQLQTLINNVYNSSSSRDALSLAEIFACVAVGASLNSKSIPDLIRKMVYSSATSLFSLDIVNSDPFRAMRLMATLATYSVIERHLSTKSLVAAALQVARCKSPQFSSQSIADCWRKVYRTLVFLDR